MLRQPFQIFFGVDRGHAAGARGRHRLAVDMILHVAAREHARDARARPGVRDDVAVHVGFELPFEE